MPVETRSKEHIEVDLMQWHLTIYRCSRYESGWRAVLAYTDGVILVYDPDSPGQDQQLTLWYDYFVKRNGLRDEQCLIFAHRGNSTEKFKPRKFSHLTF